MTERTAINKDVSPRNFMGSYQTSMEEIDKPVAEKSSLLVLLVDARSGGSEC